MLPSILKFFKKYINRTKTVVFYKNDGFLEFNIMLTRLDITPTNSDYGECIRYLNGYYNDIKPSKRDKYNERNIIQLPYLETIRLHGDIFHILEMIESKSVTAIELSVAGIDNTRTEFYKSNSLNLINKNYPNLEKLELYNVKLNRFPTELNLSKLSILSLNNCGITSLPKLEKLPNLVVLILNYNNISEISSDFRQDKITSLIIQTSKITHLPPLNLPNLNYLSLDGNMLDSMPDLSVYPKIQKFSITNYKYNDISYDFATNTGVNFGNIKELDISHSKIELPASINAPKLETIYMVGRSNIIIPRNSNLPKGLEIRINGYSDKFASSIYLG